MVRRHRKLFWVIVALGLIGGVAYAVLSPPMITSTALVVLPQLQVGQSAAASGTSTGPDIATQVVIAGSVPVLSDALPHVSPAMSLQTLQNRVQIGSEAGNILSFTADGRTAAQAETTANAVAGSYISYVSTANTPGGQLQARMLESATTASGSKLAEQAAIFALLGALAGALVGFVTSLAISRNDRRLIERDAIANSIGAPVLASIPVVHPSDAASWIKLFEGYEPGVVHGYALTRMLQQFGIAGNAASNGAYPGGASLTVLTLSSDPGALALGPQLAAFAASAGIPTALVIGPQQNMNAAATLRTACATPQLAERRRKPLQLIVSDDGNLGQLRAAFVVVVAVVDGRDPRMPGTVRSSATVLGVSAGAATAEQLAQAATAAAADGRDIVGILVANPEPGDQSTGRIPSLAPPLRRPLPTRVNDVPTEIRR